MSKAFFNGEGLRVAKGMFRKPADALHHMQLRAVARRIDGAHRVEVHEPRRSHYLDGDGTYASVPNGTRKIAPEDGVRVVVWAVDPENALNAVGDHLNLSPKPRGSGRSVKRSDVHEFLRSVEDDPMAYTESFIHATLDGWGRSALQHLRPECLAIAAHCEHDYAAYMRRYLEGDRSVDTASILRFGRKRREGWDGVGLYGWPLERRMPTRMEVFVNSGMDLIADWRWKEFVELVTDGLEGGSIVITSPARGNRSGHGRRREKATLSASGGAKGRCEIEHGAPVYIRARSVDGISRDSFAMVLRAVGALGATFANARRLRSSEPSWWHLNDDPMGYRGGELYLDGIYRSLWDLDRAVRFISPTRFMRLQKGLIIRMAFDATGQRNDAVWGVIAEREYVRGARATLGAVKRALEDHGRRVDD